MIIDRKTQGVIVRRTIAHWSLFMLSSLLISVLIRFCSNPFEGIQANLVGGLRGFLPVILTLACLGPVFVYDFLKLSNRIFGPIPRIRKTIGSLAAGEEVAPMRYRKSDTHADLINDLNRLVERLHRSTEPNTTSASAPASQDTTPANHSNVTDHDLASKVVELIQLVQTSASPNPVSDGEEPADETKSPVVESVVDSASVNESEKA